MKRSVLPVHLVGAVLLLAFSGCVAAQHGRDAGPAAAEYTFPPEWAPHEAVWLGWSTNPQHHRVQVEMIQAMAPHVRIRLMVTTDRAKAQARPTGARGCRSASGRRTSSCGRRSSVCSRSGAWCRSTRWT